MTYRRYAYGKSRRLTFRRRQSRRWTFFRPPGRWQLWWIPPVRWRQFWRFQTRWRFTPIRRWSQTRWRSAPRRIWRSRRPRRLYATSATSAQTAPRLLVRRPQTTQKKRQLPRLDPCFYHRSGDHRHGIFHHAAGLRRLRYTGGTAGTVHTNGYKAARAARRQSVYRNRLLYR